MINDVIWQPWMSPGLGPDPAFLVCLPVSSCSQLGKRKSSVGADGGAEGTGKSSLSMRTHMGQCSRSWMERLKGLPLLLALLPLCSKTLGKILHSSGLHLLPASFLLRWLSRAKRAFSLRIIWTNRAFILWWSVGWSSNTTSINAITVTWKTSTYSRDA